MNKSTGLNRILGLGFGLAIAFGNTVGVGILSLPGVVAKTVGSSFVFFAVWVVGGLYAFLGAINVGELAAMMPLVGGFYVYARRAFGERIGFMVGWNDWIVNVVTLSYAATTAAEFVLALTPSFKTQALPIIAQLGVVELFGKTPLEWVTVGAALVIVLVFLGIHWVGLQVGSQAQNVISAGVGMVLVALAIAGLFVSAPASIAVAPAAPSMPFWASLVVALRLVIVSYDGWYGAIYMAEETVDAKRNVPRAMMGCALLVTALYLLINAGFVHALGMPALSQSALPAADVAKAVLPQGTDRLITAVSLLTILSLINAGFLGTPRILLAVARDGLQGSKAASVSASGTPRASLLVSVVMVTILMVAASKNDLISIAGDLFVLNYLTAYAGLIWLRRIEPATERPFTVPGFPLTTALVLLGSVGFLLAAIWDDPPTALMAAGLLAVGLVVAAGLRQRARQSPGNG